ncbi:MAG: tetratricopeptide repeat protein [Cytophagales bacterium]|nr:tetratricopeptide repeat protein [Cytophagales bacterium]
MIRKPHIYSLLLFYLTIFSTVSTPLSADNTTEIDSLEKLCASLEGAEQVQVMNRLSELYLYWKPDSALSKAMVAYTKADALKNTLLLAVSFRNIGLAHRSQTADYEKALDFCFQAFEMAKAYGHHEEALITQQHMASIYSDVENPNRALEYLLRAEMGADSLGFTHLLVDIHNQKGLVHTDLRQFQEAFEDYDKALKLTEKDKNAEQLATTFYNRGQTYTQMGNLELALADFEQSLSIRRNLQDEYTLGDSHLKMGETLEALKNKTAARQHLVQAVEMKVRLNDKYGAARAYLSLGKYHMHQKDGATAIKLLNQSQAYAQQSRHPRSKHVLRSVYDALYQAYLLLKDYEKAMYYRTELLAMNDFIIHEENDRRVVEMESKIAKNELERKQDELNKEAKEKDQKRQETINILLVILLFVIISLLYGAWSNFKIRQQTKKLQVANNQLDIQNKELDQLNRTKDKFFSIIGHDLKGPLNSLSSFSHLLINHTDKLTTEEIQNLAKDLDKSLKNLTNLLENLLHWSRSQTGNLQLEPRALQAADIIEPSLKLLKLPGRAKGNQPALRRRRSPHLRRPQLALHRGAQPDVQRHQIYPARRAGAYQRPGVARPHGSTCARHGFGHERGDTGKALPRR